MTSQTGLRSDESSRLADAASNVADKAGQTVEAGASTAMDQIAHTVEQVAHAVRRAGQELRQDQPQIASFADSAATQVDHLADYLEGHEPRELLGSFEDAARRQPAVVIGAGIAIGLVLGRLLRSTLPMNGSSSASSRYRGTAYGSSYGGTSYRGASSGYGYGGSSMTGRSEMSGGTNGGGFSDTGDTGSSIVASTRAVPAGGTIDTGSTSSTTTRSTRSRSTGGSNG